MDKKVPYESSRLTVLIVDDHPQIRKAVLRVVGKMDFGQVLEAGNGSEAIKILQEQPVDLVILDLYLLDISGFEVLEYIRNREVDPDIPVLVVTGEASKDEIVKAADLGANDYLLKPFQSEDLSLKCTQLLTKYYSPSPLISLIRKAERLFLEKKYANAVVTIEQALQRDPKSVRSRYIKAITLDKLGQVETAVKILKESIDLNENFYRIHASLADIYLRQKLNEEAIEFMTRELELNPKQPKRQTQLGTLLLSAGKIENSIEHFREALKENVRFRLALFGMGRAYAAIGNIEKAVYYYKRLRRYYPTNTKALEAIVKCCLDADDPTRAEHALKDEKNANKSRPDVYLVLAKFYLAMDRKLDAFGALDELKNIEVDNREASKLRAAIHCKYGELKPAIDIYSQLIKKDEDYDTLINYANILAEAKQHQDAAIILNRCFKHTNDHSEILRRLAVCYQQLGEPAKAQIIFSRILLKYGFDGEVRNQQEQCFKAVLERRGGNKRIAS